jgi:Dolichyl-phosphate-mannose-protein mannosyltransferase
VTPTTRDRRPRGFVAAVVAILLLALVVRAVALDSGLPYSSYIDEGHFLHPTAHMIANDTFKGGSYQHPYEHPSLLYDATAGGAEVYRVLGGTGIKTGAQVTDRSPYYDIIEPSSLILIGRLVVLMFSLGIVLVTILLAERLIGRRGALMAGALVAVLPAMVSRGAIVIVDTPAAFFVVLTLLLLSRLDTTRRRTLMATMAGASAGLAFTSKYTSAAIIIAVAVVIALQPGWSWVAKGRAAVGALVGAVVAAVVTMPDLVFGFSQVLADVRYEANAYTRYDVGHYWEQLPGHLEVGWLVIGLAVVGLVSLLRRPSTRIITLGWIAFLVPFVGYLAAQPYQPVRNLLPGLSFLVIAASEGILVLVRGASRVHPLSRSTRTIVAFAITVAVMLILLGTGVRPYLDANAGVVDTRTQALDWLVDHVQPGQRVLVAEELAMLPDQLERIRGRVVVAPATGSSTANPTDYDFVVTSAFRPTAYFSQATPAWVPPDGAPPLVRFGTGSILDVPGSWHGNHEPIQIYRR